MRFEYTHSIPLPGQGAGELPAPVPHNFPPDGNTVGRFHWEAVLWNISTRSSAAGLICAIGQILIDKTQLTPARILTGYVVTGVALSALGLYEPLVKWGGAGATVPLTGFGHSLAQGVKTAVAKDGWLGIFTGGALRHSRRYRGGGGVRRFDGAAVQGGR